MNDAVSATAPHKRSILHPTDFSASSHTAYVHALRIALCGRAKLTLVHVGNRGRGAWTEHPGIRETLSRWGVVDRNAGRSEVVDLGITATKVHLKGANRVRGVLHRANKAQADLIVLSTKRRGGVSRLLRPSVGLAIARQAEVPVLILPGRVQGFVDRRTGNVRVRRVLFPVAPDVDPIVAMEQAAALMRDLDVADAGFRVLTVNSDGDPELPDCGFKVDRVRRDGDVVDAIEAEARTGVDLVVMTSLGRDTAQDRLFGSTTERVLARLRVPLMVVPGGH